MKLKGVMPALYGIITKSLCSTGKPGRNFFMF